MSRQGSRRVRWFRPIGGLSLAVLMAGRDGDPCGQGATAEVKPADLHQGRLADPPAAVPELPPSRSGRAVLARDLRAGPQAGERHRRGGRGQVDAALEAGGGGGPEAQARPVAHRGRDRRARRLGRGGRPQGRGQARSAGPEVHGRLEAGHARPRPRDGRGFHRPGLRAGPLSLLRDPHQPEARRLHLGRRVPAGEQAGGPPLHGVPRHQRRGRMRDELDPGPGYTSYSGPGVEVEGDLGGWAAGNTPHHLPEGIGRPVPAFSDVILQVHYHPSGKPEVDRSRLAIYFCKKPVKQTLHWANATEQHLPPPAGQGRQRGEGHLERPRRRRGPRRHPPHAPARPRLPDDA